MYFATKLVINIFHSIKLEVQMTTSRVQALGEGNFAALTWRGKKAVECMGGPEPHVRWHGENGQR